VAKAKALLNASIATPSDLFHLGGFLHAVTSNLLPDAPALAWTFFQKLEFGSLEIHVTSQFDVPAFYTSLWDLARCSSAGRYLDEYLSKDWEHRLPEDKGARCVRYFGHWAKGQRAAGERRAVPPNSSRFGWVFDQRTCESNCAFSTSGSMLRLVAMWSRVRLSQPG